MFKLIKNNKAVSQVLSFVLSLGLTATVVVAAGFLTTYYVDKNLKSAAQAEAENLANQVVNLLINAYLIKEQYPNADYSTSMDIPLKLVNHFYYTITVNDNGVHVNSKDNSVQVTKTYFYPLNTNVVDSSVDGSEGGLTVNIALIGGVGPGREISVEGGL